MPPHERVHYSDDDIRSIWVDEPPQLNSTVTLAEYDPAWPGLFQREAERIRTVLGKQVRRLEHIGSTSVPGLCAKPIVDILLVVPDSSDEAGYLAALEAAGYRLVIREPEQDEHRALKGPDTDINLHVYSQGCAEIERYLRFRDRLRTHDAERDRYAEVKRALAARTWQYIQHYADAKNEIVDEIHARADAEANATTDTEQTVPYDEFARRYADHAASNPFQTLYDRPAILDLAGDVTGLRVLDAGCAAGYLSAALAARGAEVTGIDVSEQLLAIARERNAANGTVEYRRADLAEPLDFVADGSVDLVTASLVLHYLRDWAPTLAEFRRVLRPGGVVVASVHHPEDWHWFEGTRYFETELLTDEWSMVDDLAPQRVQFYRRPLSATFAAARAAGFVVDALVEPQPLPECETADPGAFAMLTGGPRFLYLRLISPAS